MIHYKNWLLPLLFLFGGASQALETLVDVQSTYQDQAHVSSNGQVVVKGSGWLFTHNNNAYVFTAAHVSQGQQTEISLNGQKLSILKRLLSDQMDTEIFQVGGVDPKQVNIQFVNEHFELQQAFSGRTRWVDSIDYVPVHEWVKDPHGETDSAYFKQQTVNVFMDAFANLLNSSALVQPGMSGAPLITVMPVKSDWKQDIWAYDIREGFNKNNIASRHYIRGLVIRRDRFFSSSSFIPLYRMKDLFSSFLAGKTLKSAYQWQANGALLLRKDTRPDGLVEAKALGAAMAGGLMIDGGNGVSMDGGDGASMHENSPTQFLTKVDAYPYHENKPAHYWMLMMRSPLSKNLINSFAWFDLEYYAVMKRFIFSLMPADEKGVMTFTKLISVRLNKQIPFEFTDKDKFVSVANGIINVKVQIPGDSLHITMDRLGRICATPPCQGFFVPVVEVVSQVKKQTYIVDLRRMFFTDFSSNKMLSLRSLADMVKDDADYNKRVWQEVSTVPLPWDLN